jgi:hypothetical protein
VERGRVEVRAVRPHERMNLWVQTHLAEELRVLEGTVKLAGQYRRKVDRLPRSVGEFHVQAVGADTVKRSHPMERVRGHDSYCSGAIGRAGRPAWSLSQSALSSS